MSSRASQNLDKLTGAAGSRKVSDRYLNFIFRTFRNSHPQHIFGRDPKNHALVEAAKQEEIKKHIAKHPDKATPEELHKYELPLLCAARKSAYDALPAAKKSHWQTLADQTAPVDDEDLQVTFDAFFSSP